MATDYYAALGVKRDAAEKEIRSAYRKLARKLHPDVNPGNADAEARFKEVNAAYEVLSDPEKRKKYDRYGDNWEHADEIERARRAGGGRSGNFYTYTSSPGFDFQDVGDLDGLFGNFFGRGRGRQATMPVDLEQPVEISLREAFSGTTRLLAAEGGRRIEVRIPPGVTDGSRVRVAGEGREAGSRKGDLYLVVAVQPDRRYERRGDDLHTEVEVPLTTAVLGGEVTVESLDRKVALTIPPLTQNERVFRLGRLGMPKLGRESERGDLFAKAKVRLPKALTDDQKTLVEQLKATGL
jgi:DnaJ-class molecular chaperone